MNLSRNIALISLIAFHSTLASAQSGRPIDSVDMTAGTSVPRSPTDPVHPVREQEKDEITLPRNSILNLDRETQVTSKRKNRQKKATPAQDHTSPSQVNPTKVNSPE